MLTAAAARRLSGMALGLAIAVAGGALFRALSLPLPWMLGAMCACMAAALSPLPVASVRSIRPPFAAIIGIALGSAFTPQTFAHVAGWAPITVSVVLYSVSIASFGFLYLRRFVGLDPVTAYFSSVPAGLYEMTVQGARRGGDERWIALIQGLRIFLVVLTIPLAMRLSGALDASTAGLAFSPRIAARDAADFAALFGCAAIGWPLARVIRLPNPAMIGPMLLSTLAHSTGLTNTAPPGYMISAAQVLLGATIGLQFTGASVAMLRRGAVHGIVLAFSMMAFCAGFAAACSLMTGIDRRVLILTLAPAGMTEMSLMALAMHAEVAIVSTHHVLRSLMVQLLAPAFARLFPRTTALASE